MDGGNLDFEKNFLIQDRSRALKAVGCVLKTLELTSSIPLVGFEGSVYRVEFNSHLIYENTMIHCYIYGKPYG